MERLEMRGLDVSAMRTLVVIHDTLSFTECAQRLGLSQSTISYTVRGLRDIFGDPLFLRTGNRVEPTVRCRLIVDELRDVLSRLDGLAASKPFAPSSATGDIVISCNFHERRSLMPAAISELREKAPGLRIRLHEAAVDGKRQLTENLSDIVLGPVAIMGEIFYRTHLFTDRYVCLMDRANPLAQGRITLERYRKAKHLAVTHNDRWEAIFLPLLRARGVDIEPAVSVPSHDSIERLLAGSDLVASIPARLAKECAEPLITRDFPFEVPIKINMYWTERTHHSGAHGWVRSILANTARRSLSPGMG